jgi:trans-2,3-dihydro-3-hydroxyanthranilate isomerase
MHTFYILDVFAEEKYAGNQLAVVRDAGDIPDDEMQRIAKEMNYSETTFILSEKSRNDGWDVRIFTPEAELPFAGHPTLGTAYVIQKEVIGKPVEGVVLNLGVGQIPVTFEQDECLWMRQVEPEFGETFDPDTLATILNLKSEDIDTRFPIQEVSTGFFTLVVPLISLDAVKRATVNIEEHSKLIARSRAKTILIFAPGTYHPENDLNVRFFGHFLGVPEDPATGSANGCLAGYLVKHRYFDSNRLDIRVEQGHEMGRPSLLRLAADDREGKIAVNVGGRVVMVAKGELL